MQRVMVIGVSAGVGKSTFARRLGEIISINVHHLDASYWKPGWVESSKEAFSQAQQKIVKQDQWIIEGNYSSTFDIRMKDADTIIYLELSLIVCLYRVVKRWLTNLGKTRADMAEGCKEKLDWEFIHFIYTTYYPRKKKMRERFRILKEGSRKEIIVLRSKQEIWGFLRSMEMYSNGGEV